MRALTAALWITLPSLVLLPGTTAPAEQKVEVKVVKYPELTKTIKQLKGKVVVVDLWSFY
jgi:hypothetical protein